MIKIKSHSDFVIFFDESGKLASDKVQLMGAVGLPSNIYFSDKYLMMRELNKVYNLHWKDYKGDGKQREGIIKVFQKAHSLAKYTTLNFIRYFSSSLSQRVKKYDHAMESTDKSILYEMIYSKLPERIIYGILRGYGNSDWLKVSINIEDACEYRVINLGENLKRQLNLHSLYRGESFIVDDCEYRKKGEEVGVELTDILLGIVRTILENNAATSRKKRAQIQLIIYLLQNDLLQPFIKNMKLFELRNSAELIEIDMLSCVNMFISQNYKLLSD